MILRHRSPSIRLGYRLGLAALLAAAAEGPVFDRLIPAALAQEAADWTFGAPPPPFEAAPEVLALADWPLDRWWPADEAASLVDYEPLPAPIAIEPSPVVRVVAGEPDLETAVSRNEATDGEPANPLGGRLAAIADDDLDGIRGGFELEPSLKLSFGIERAVFINGELIATSVLNVRDLQGAAGGGGQPANAQALPAASLGIVQNGSGNYVSIPPGANLGGTIIQNTLDNQQIRNVTTINASVNSGQVLRALAMQAAISDGIVGSLRR